MMTTTTSTRRVAERAEQASRAAADRTPGGWNAKRILFPLGFLVIALIVWETAPGALNLPEYVLPKMSKVLGILTDFNTIKLYLQHAGTTVMEAMLGLSLGTATGLTLGILFSQIPLLYITLYPYVVAIQAIPKVALAPLFVVWFGFGIESKVVVVFLLTLFPVLVNTITGMRATDEESRELFLTLGASRLTTLRKLLIPNAMPSILTGFEIAVVVSMLGAIVGEFVGAQKGLGLLILQAQFQMNIAGVFSILIVLIVYGVGMNALVRLLRKKVLFWMANEARGGAGATSG